MWKCFMVLLWFVVFVVSANAAFFVTAAVLYIFFVPILALDGAWNEPRFVLRRAVVNLLSAAVALVFGMIAARRTVKHCDEKRLAKKICQNDLSSSNNLRPSA